MSRVDGVQPIFHYEGTFIADLTGVGCLAANLTPALPLAQVDRLSEPGIQREWGQVIATCQPTTAEHGKQACLLQYIGSYL